MFPCVIKKEKKRKEVSSFKMPNIC